MSDRALSCPHCGSPAQQMQQAQPMYAAPMPQMYGQPLRKSKAPVIIGVIIGVFVLLGSVIAATMLPTVNGLTNGTGSGTTIANAGSGGTHSSQGTGTQNNSQGAGTQNNGQSADTQIKTYSVTLHVECIENIKANKYDVDILVDDEPIATLAHGAADDYTLELDEGTHKVEFRVNGKHSFLTGGDDIYDPDKSETFKIQNIRVSKNSEYSFSAKLVWGDGIKVEQVT